MIENLKDAIAHARETASKLRKMTSITNGKPYEECLECASEHEQLAAWLTELQERREADKWISVKDKLPDKKGRCLVFTDYGDVTMDSFVDGLFVCNLGNVTHWKPLPKAPESEAENETDN